MSFDDGCIRRSATTREMARRRRRLCRQSFGVRGFFADDAVPGNYPAIDAFRYHVIKGWLRSRHAEGVRGTTAA